MRFFLITVAAILAVSIGAFFYFSDPDIPRATLELKYATPPSQFLQLADGTRAHVRDRGPRNAPVLVLIHGNMVYADTGHFTHEEVPDQSAADCRAFLLAWNKP
jgi:hypothetical protein